MNAKPHTLRRAVWAQRARVAGLTAIAAGRRAAVIGAGQVALSVGQLALSSTRADSTADDPERVMRTLAQLARGAAVAASCITQVQALLARLDVTGPTKLAAHELRSRCAMASTLINHIATNGGAVSPSFLRSIDELKNDTACWLARVLSNGGR